MGVGGGGSKKWQRPMRIRQWHRRRGKKMYVFSKLKCFQGCWSLVELVLGGTLPW